MSALVDLAVKATLLLCFAGVTVALMRRATASSRHLVWLGAFCAIALLPLARIGMPALRVAVFPAPAATNPAPTSAVVFQDPTTGAPPNAVQSSLTGETAPAPGRSAAGSSQDPRGFTADQIILGAWMIGALALIVRLGLGRVLLHRSVQRAKPVTCSSTLLQLERTARHFQVRRPVRLLTVDGHGLPCTFGVRRPVILLPETLLRDHSRISAVLAHEMSHIARLDALAEIVMRVAMLAHWFNPLMWFGARLARLERERAADDAVLAGGTKASDYADELLAIANAPRLPTSTSAIPMASSPLERRVRAILDQSVRRGGRSRISLAVAFMLPLVMLPIAATQLVAQEPNPAGVRTAPSALDAISAAVPAIQPISLSLPRLQLRDQDALPAAAVTPSQTPAPQPSPTPMSLATWEAERLAMLEEVLKRAQAYWADSLKRVEIGTTAPIDTIALETAVAQIEQQVLSQRKTVADTKPGSHAVAGLQRETARLRYNTALSNLDVVAIRFNNGLASTKDVAAALNAATAATVNRTFPDHLAGSHAFTFGAGDGLASAMNAIGTSTSSWQAVNSDVDLLAAIRATVKTTSEAARADALIALAQNFAFTAEMAAAWVDAAKTITDEKIRARVFAQPVKLKGEVNVDSGPGSPRSSPAEEMFTAANFPNSTPADRANARSLYELLTGRTNVVPAAIPEFVSVTGSVRAPGQYPFKPGMKVLDALAAAGGLLPTADKTRIQLVTTASPQGTPQVKPETRTFYFLDLEQVSTLATNNLALRPGDHVVVR